MSNGKVIRGFFRFSVVCCCVTWLGVSEILNQQGGSSFEISGTTNSNTVSHPRRPDSELLYCANLKSHTGFIFSFSSSTSVPVIGQRNSIQGCWNCLTVSFGSLSHIFIWDIVELYLTILNVQRTFISYLLAPLMIVSVLFNSLAIWLRLLFISVSRTREFHLFCFYPKWVMSCCEMRDDPHLCTVSLFLHPNVSTFLRHLNFAVTALFRDCSEDICWQTYPSRCHFSGFIKFYMLGNF